MNKIAYINANHYREIYKNIPSTSCDNRTMEQYKSIGEKYYADMFGLKMLNWWTVSTMKSEIVDESKFALFVLSYSEYIEKII